MGNSNTPQAHLEVGCGGDCGPILPGAGGEPDLTLDAAPGDAGDQVQAQPGARLSLKWENVKWSRSQAAHRVMERRC